MKFYGIHEDEQVCANCKHFYQHYVRSERYVPINAGHCCYPRIKSRKPTDSCDYYGTKVSETGRETA